MHSKRTDQVMEPGQTMIPEIPIIKPEEKTGERPQGNTLVYIGPGLKGVISGTVFNGGLPSSLKNHIQAVPAIGELVVPLEHLVDANKQLTDYGSPLSRFYKAAARYQKGDR